MAFFRKPETPAQKKKFWFILLGGSAFLILFLVYVQMTIGLVGKPIVQKTPDFILTVLSWQSICVVLREIM